MTTGKASASLRELPVADPHELKEGLTGNAVSYNIELKFQDYFVASPMLSEPMVVKRGLLLGNLTLVIITSAIVWVFTLAPGYFVSRLFRFYRPLVGKEQVAVEPLHEHDIGRTYHLCSFEIVPKELILLTHIAPATHASLIIRQHMRLG